VEPPTGQSAAAGIDRQFPFERYPLASLDKILGTITFAETEIFQPVDRMKAEPVIKLCDIDITRLEIGASPHHFGDLGLRLGVERLELGPAVAIAHGRANSLDPDWRVPEVAGDIHPRHDDRRRSVDRDIAVIEMERRGNDRRGKIFVDRDWRLVDRIGIERGVAPLVDRDLADLFGADPAFVHVEIEIERLLQGRCISIIRRIPGEWPRLPLSGAQQRIGISGLARRRFIHCPKNQDVPAETSSNRANCVEHGTILSRSLAPSCIPVDLQPHRILQGGTADRRETRAIGAVARPGCYSVDIAAFKTSIGHGLERGIHGQRERRFGCTA